jgi:hypothetical protein
MLIRSEFHEDVTKPSHGNKRSTVATGSVDEQGTTDMCVRSSHVKNAVSSQLQCHSESVCALVIVLQCIVLLGETISSAMVQSLPLTP